MFVKACWQKDAQWMSNEWAIQMPYIKSYLINASSTRQWLQTRTETKNNIAHVMV